MKKAYKRITITLVLVFSILTTNIVNAQIQKGNWLIGGSGSFTINNSKYTVVPQNTGLNNIYNQEAVNKNFDLGCNLSYFLTDHFTIGITPNFTYNVVKDKNSLSSTSTSNETIISLGFLSRYYFLNPLNQNFNLIGELSYGLSNHKLMQNESGIGKYSSIFIGPTYFINKNIGLELLFGFKNDNLDYENQKTFYSNSNFSSKLGLQIYLN